LVFFIERIFIVRRHSGVSLIVFCTLVFSAVSFSVPQVVSAGVIGNILNIGKVPPKTELSVSECWKEGEGNHPEESIALMKAVAGTYEMTNIPVQSNYSERRRDPEVYPAINAELLNIDKTNGTIEVKFENETWEMNIGHVPGEHPYMRDSRCHSPFENSMFQGCGEDYRVESTQFWGEKLATEGKYYRCLKAVLDGEGKIRSLVFFEFNDKSKMARGHVRLYTTDASKELGGVLPVPAVYEFSTGTGEALKVEIGMTFITLPGTNKHAVSIDDHRYTFSRIHDHKNVVDKGVDLENLAAAGLTMDNVAYAIGGQYRSGGGFFRIQPGGGIATDYVFAFNKEGAPMFVHLFIQDDGEHTTKIFIPVGGTF